MNSTNGNKTKINIIARTTPLSKHRHNSHNCQVLAKKQQLIRIKGEQAGKIIIF